MMKTIRSIRFSMLIRWTTAMTVLALLSACGANEGILRSGKETPAPIDPANVLSQFEQDLKSMQTARFKYIYVLRRKDNETLDAEDRGVIKINTSQVNRRIASDDDRAFLIGSNFELEEKNIKALRDRFAVEDHSPPPVETNSNSNNVSNK